MLGAGLAAVVFVLVLSVGRSEVTSAPTGDFYDLQARAWFDGRWDIADRVDPVTGSVTSPLSYEAIVIDGRDYLYYGPVPSLLRVPLLAVTDTLDGELTQASMLVAFVVSLVALTVLGWRVRWLVRGPAVPLGRGEVWGAGVTTAAVGTGTVLAYLASQPTVYHEAELWGAALALVAFVPVLALAVRVAPPPAATVALASGAATLALMTRASVGAGPVVALGLLAGREIVRAVRRPGTLPGSSRGSLPGSLPGTPAGSASDSSPGSEPAPHERQPGAWSLLAALALVAACTLPLAVYAAVNHARFGTFFQLPLDQQVFSDIDPGRQAALADNGGSLFGLRFLPSTLWQYSRPDALDLDGLVPWVTFPRSPATVIGDVTFDTRDEASSVPATMPALVALGVVGVVAMVRHRRLRPLAWPVAGAVVGTVPVFTIAFIAHRYLADLVVPLLLCSLAGLHALVAWWPRARPRQRWLAGLALGVAAVWGVVANLALALEYQRLIAPVDPATRTAFVAWQYTLASGSPRVQERSETPEGDQPGRRGDIVAVTGSGGSSAVWWTDGFSWTELAGLECSGVGAGREATHP